MQQDKRPYRAIVWGKDPNQPGKRVIVFAVDLDEARRLLEQEHGEGNVFNLHNEEDAAKPRGIQP